MRFPLLAFLLALLVLTRPAPAIAAVDFTAPPVQDARALIQSGKAECVLVVNGQVFAPRRGRGVNPLLEFYEKNAEQMAGAIVVDKVIGRAAAAIAISGKAKAVFAELMSEDGAAFLKQHGIEAGYARMVPRILNQKRDGLCPLEQSVLGIDDPAKAVVALKARIAELRALAPKR
jgi:hypothetical protein